MAVLLDGDATCETWMVENWADAADGDVNGFDDMVRLLQQQQRY